MSQTNTPKYSIVVPCYNEAANIPLILKRFSEVMNRSDLEVVLVNNGSTDQSEAVLSQELPRYPFAKTVHVKQNQGYGFGIMAGLNECLGEFIGWTHADMQTDPHDVLRAILILESESSPETSYVKGCRKKRPLFDQFFTIGMSCFETYYLKTRLWDINAQPNLFHRSFFKSWENPPFDFALDLYVLYQAKKQSLTIHRFPVFFPERIHGESSWNTGLGAKWKFIRRTLSFSKVLKKSLD